MEVNIYDDKKIVEVWLSNAEKTDTSIKSRLKSLYEEQKNKKYTVAVFESGNGNLLDNTAGLLLHNRMKTQ